MFNPRNGLLSSNSLLNDSGKDPINLAEVASVLYALTYAGTYLYYLIGLLFKVDFLYGHYRPTLKPGPFIDDRYSWIWVIEIKIK